MTRYATLGASGYVVDNPLVDGQSNARTVKSSTKVMTNGDTVFTIAGGPIMIEELFSECITAQGAGATTMQWRSVPTVGTAATFSGASASLANQTAGSTARLAPTALTTALTLVAASAAGQSLGTNVANRIIVKEGTIRLVIATGPSTGTYRHVMRYKPLAPTVTVTAV